MRRIFSAPVAALVFSCVFFFGRWNCMANYLVHVGYNSNVQQIIKMLQRNKNSEHESKWNIKKYLWKILSAPEKRKYKNCNALITFIIVGKHLNYTKKVFLFLFLSDWSERARSFPAKKRRTKKLFSPKENGMRVQLECNKIIINILMEILQSCTIFFVGRCRCFFLLPCRFSRSL